MERKNARVAVLISVYNGEKYLREQLDSLLGQTYPNITVLARDDGSKDSSASILAEYARAVTDEASKRIRIISDGKRLKYPECFYELMRYAQDAEYIAFSDQDDWWYPGKIARAVEVLEKKGGSERPLLTFCASEQCAADLTPIRVRRAPDEMGLPACALNASLAPGFAIVISKALLDIVLPRVQGTAIHHDRLLCRAAAYLGEIVPDNEIGAKHRLHETSFTAEHRSDAETKTEKEAEIWNALRTENAEFLARFGDLLNAKSRREAKAFSIGNKWKRVFYPRRLRKGLRSEWKLRLRYLREKR